MYKRGSVLFLLSALVLTSAPYSWAELAHFVPLEVKTSSVISALAAEQELELSIVLPWSNSEQLAELIQAQYDPASPSYRKFLSSDEFVAKFGPSQSDFEALQDYFSQRGFQVTEKAFRSGFFKVKAPAQQIESLLGIKLKNYMSRSGRVFFGHDEEPAIPAEISSKILAIHGLNNAVQYHTYNRRPAKSSPKAKGLTPAQVRDAYNFAPVQANYQGQGQSLALFELDGYKTANIQSYLKKYPTELSAFSTSKLQNVLVGGFDGSAGDGEVEVELDIELMANIAPQIDHLYVYEGPNSDAGLTATYAKIADDNFAKTVSVSWGQNEAGNTSAVIQSETQTFQRMIAQGQAVYAASGDSGAYDDAAGGGKATLSVDDPASNPNVVGVGGTTLTLTNNAWTSESSWGTQDPLNGNSGGGGGVSSLWPIPSWQAPLVNAASKGSTTHRNVPDVALDADPSTGYEVYVTISTNLGGTGKAGLTVVGGTSCAAPIMAAYMALVNQKRVAEGKPVLGFPNPTFYAIGQNSTQYANDFHDVKDGSTNLYYPAVAGYDDSTGLGSLNAGNLINDL